MGRRSIKVLLKTNSGFFKISIKYYLYNMQLIRCTVVIGSFFNARMANYPRDVRTKYASVKRFSERLTAEVLTAYKYLVRCQRKKISKNSSYSLGIFLAIFRTSA